MKVKLKKFPYKYLEYEKNLLIREIQVLFPHASVSIAPKQIELDSVDTNEIPKLALLTYIQAYQIENESDWHETIQSILEKDNNSTAAKQHTRYSTHGIHEYKGKFNPQIVHALLNILNISQNNTVLDPFNGSGTTILECAHFGINAYGTDINPMACFISNAKIKSLSINVESAKSQVADLFNSLYQPFENYPFLNDARTDYLLHWIPQRTLAQLETIRSFALSNCDDLSSLILVVASDLIRDYSYQEPTDLRIRKRFSPFPSETFESAFKNNLNKYFQKIQDIQQSLGIVYSDNTAINCDIKNADCLDHVSFDAAITSPPYVTALPYIDTQRISLVWLELCTPSDIIPMESTLIGSRELIKNDKQHWNTAMNENTFDIPSKLYELVIEMKNSLSDIDGFRKQAVPVLLYRYLAEMKQMFINVSKLLKSNAPFALIVGHNRTTLGGKEFFLDTPALLAELAVSCGWELKELTALETYKRYGLHVKNSINKETLIVLTNKK